MIITITAPSGAGKSTLAKGLLEKLPNARLFESVTTRPRREKDLPDEYLYVKEGHFVLMQSTGEFLWHLYVHGFHFGTRKKALEEALIAKENYVAILVIEKVEQLYRYAVAHNLQEEVCSLYLYLNDEAELRRRLIERGDTPNIEERIAECRTWNQRMTKPNFPFFNLDASKPREEVLAQATACIQTV